MERYNFWRRDDPVNISLRDATELQANASLELGAMMLISSRLSAWIQGLRGSISHPMATGRTLDVLRRSARLALWSGACPDLQLFPWLGGHPLIGTSGYSGYFRNHLHEYADLCFAAHFLKPDDLFVDGGANVGSWTVLASLHSGADVLAIEPAPDTLKVLRANIALNGIEEKVTVAPFALSDHSGEASMAGTGLTRSVKALADRRNQEPLIQLRTLSELLDLREPALVKLDLEGHELQALRGAGAWLTERKVAAWCLEANSESDAIALNAVMKSAGYALRYYVPEHRKLIETRPDPCWQFNLIFVRDPQEAEARLAVGRAIISLGRTI